RRGRARRRGGRLFRVRAGRLVFGRRPEALGEPLDRPGEVELLGVTDERDYIPARAAAEAVEELVLGVHGEARRALLVEGTAPDIARTRLAQLRPSRDDFDHVGRVNRLANGGVLDARHQSFSA